MARSLADGMTGDGTARPIDRGYSMPPEWNRHRRTWMAFPSASYAVEAETDVFGAWSAVANTIARYEPVVMVVDPDFVSEARARLAPTIEIAPIRLDDAWMRDIGPTFLLDPDGRLGAVDWVFNGWGQQEWARWDHDADVAPAVIARAGAVGFGSPLVNEGGAIHVDGDGTVLLTETVQLDPDRKPGWSKADVEAELRATLGIEHAVWLERGLTTDHDLYGTRGHIDTLAAFVRPGLIVAHDQPDPTHPDHEIAAANLDRLRRATDAHGRPFTVVTLDAPAVREVNGRLVDYTYVNYYVGNGFVLLCGFGDPQDRAMVELFARLFPDRVIEMCDATSLFAWGGGIHCITQQEPE
jgi:agmatine deiminase